MQPETSINPQKRKNMDWNYFLEHQTQFFQAAYNVGKFTLQKTKVDSSTMARTIYNDYRRISTLMKPVSPIYDKEKLSKLETRIKNTELATRSLFGFCFKNKEKEVCNQLTFMIGHLVLMQDAFRR